MKLTFRHLEVGGRVFPKGPSSMAGVATNIAAAPSLKSFKASGSHFWIAHQRLKHPKQGLPENSKKSTEGCFFCLLGWKKILF